MVKTMLRKMDNPPLLTCIKQYLVLKTIYFFLFLIVTVLDRFYCMSLIVYSMQFLLHGFMIWSMTVECPVSYSLVFRETVSLRARYLNGYILRQ